MLAVCERLTKSTLYQIHGSSHSRENKNKGKKNAQVLQRVHSVFIYTYKLQKGCSLSSLTKSFNNFFFHRFPYFSYNKISMAISVAHQPTIGNGSMEIYDIFFRKRSVFFLTNLDHISLRMNFK